MVVCLTTTWLVMSGIRYIFEADLILLSDDATLFQFLYGESDSESGGLPTGGERYMMRNWGCAMLAKGVLDLCVTFGGSPQFTFTMLASFNILVVWSSMASIFLSSGSNEGIPLSFNSEVVLTIMLIAEAPCLYKLGETNGVGEVDDDGDDD